MPASSEAQEVVTIRNNNGNSLMTEVGKTMSQASDEIDRLRAQLARSQELEAAKHKALLEVLTGLEGMMMLAYRAKHGGPIEARQLSDDIIERLVNFEAPDFFPSEVAPCVTCGGAGRVAVDDVSSLVRCPDCKEG